MMKAVKDVDGGLADAAAGEQVLNLRADLHIPDTCASPRR